MKQLVWIPLLLLTITTMAMQHLYIQPQAGRAPILNFIKHAQSSLDIVMYEISDPKIIRAIIHDAKRHIKVKVMLSPETFDGNNNKTIKQLKQGGVDVKTGNPRFEFTHEKMLLSDNKVAMIGTGNLDFNRYPNTRNFFLTTDNATDVKQIRYVFNRDWQRKPVWFLKKTNLVWSPNNSQKKLVQFIKQTKHQLDIDMLSISDWKIMEALENAVKRGVKVTIVMTQVSWSPREIKTLHQAGVHIKVIEHPFIHAKAMIRPDSHMAFLGSENLTWTSLHKNRELGIITQQPAIVTQLVKTFELDERHATAYKG